MTKRQDAQAALDDLGCEDGPHEWYKRHSNTITAALEAMAEDGWRPIESAPRDGEEILLAELCNNGEWERGQAYWCVRENKWYEQNTHYTDFHDRSWDTPTHWMPLPQPPKGTNKNE